MTSRSISAQISSKFPLFGVSKSRRSLQVGERVSFELRPAEFGVGVLMNTGKRWLIHAFGLQHAYIHVRIRFDFSFLFFLGVVFRQIGLGGNFSLETISTPTEVVLWQSAPRASTKCIDATAGQCISFERENKIKRGRSSYTSIFGLT